MMDEQREAKTGRPSSFTQEMADLICERIGSGESLRAICRDAEMPAQSTVFKWLVDFKSFSEQYARAREAQTEALAEEILEIADDGRNDTYTDEDGNERTNHDVVARSRLRVDSRKWLMSKLAPKKYGEKITQEHTGPDGGPVVTRIELVAPDVNSAD